MSSLRGDGAAGDRGRANDGLMIGVDVGGTKVSVAALRAGEVGEPLINPTDVSTAEHLVAQIVAAVNQVAGGEQIAAVGIGVPSVVEFATGRVRSSVNIPLQDVPLREVLERELGIAVFVDNDATVAAIAEAHDEHGKLDVQNLVMFTVGTGVGGGIFIGGRPYRGATGAAGELGQTSIGIEHDIPHAKKTFPQAGSLEALAAGRELDRLAVEAAGAHPDSALADLLGQRGSVSGRDAVSAARDGDAAALGVLQIIGRRLGIAVANAINTFDPDVVAIGGGVSSAGDLLLTPIQATAREYVLGGVGTKTEIRLARSGPQAGVRGAALLARSEFHAHHDHGEAR